MDEFLNVPVTVALFEKDRQALEKTRRNTGLIGISTIIDIIDKIIAEDERRKQRYAESHRTYFYLRAIQNILEESRHHFV